MVAFSRITTSDSKPATGRELEEIARREYAKAVAEGRCEGPWPRWRGWFD